MIHAKIYTEQTKLGDTKNHAKTMLNEDSGTTQLASPADDFFPGINGEPLRPMEWIVRVLKADPRPREPQSFVQPDGSQLLLPPALRANRPAKSHPKLNNPEFFRARVEELIVRAAQRGLFIIPGQTYSGKDCELAFVLHGHTIRAQATVILGKIAGDRPPLLSRYLTPDFKMRLIAALARERGGRLLDGQSFMDNKTSLLFEDAGGNSFSATATFLFSGGWSPHEGTYSEHACRQAFEHLFSRSFPSRWDVVVQSSGAKLQLDGFCEELGVAFEYQGHWHAVDAALQARDREKASACAAKNILLVCVDAFDNNKKHESDYVLKHVLAALKKSFNASPRLLPKLNEEPFGIDFSAISHSVRHLRQLEDYIALHHPGGRLVPGQSFRGSRVKMDFQDADGRVFSAVPNSILSGSWSPFEAGQVSDKDWQMQRLVQVAQGFGGQVEPGQTYVNDKTKIWLVDKAGNRFQKTPSDLKQGRWSPFEAGRIYDPVAQMERLEKIAQSRGGSLVPGQTYKGASIKLEFEDAAGRRFWMRPSHILDGVWSPAEAGQNRDPLHWMGVLAERAAEHDCELVPGQTYQNAKTRMWFREKASGEVFSQSMDAIKQGRWKPR
jgi:hypothetical protein